ncbi:MAG: metalloregulator ArsR/SmtB family transcription factor [Acidimicrobiales bacterium]|nr:metalloregulator ArsR/SmtB family transcription factor [Acidimicrobiales bacterium]MDG1876263.1 metalloregulator ArsR/SmtB family transcription factor [Acidimicrobiales bacterium]
MALAEPTTIVDLEAALKALASERRLQILEWLKDVPANFPPQEYGDHLTDGACNQFIVEKLGVSQPAGSRHLKVLVDVGMIVPTRRKGWTYYRRDDATIAAVAARMTEV